LDIAKKLEEAALKDSYFVERNYIRMWISTAESSCAPSGFRRDVHRYFCDWPDAGMDCQLQGNLDEPKSRIYRPRQIYNATH